MDAARDKMLPYLEHLDALAFVQEVRVLEWSPEGMPGRPTAIVLVRTHAGKAHRFLVQQTGSFPTYAFLDALAARNAQGVGGLPWMLFAPRITTAQGEHLRGEGLCYVDRAGNCRVALGEDHVALVAGLQDEKPRRAKDRALRAAGYKIIFALLAEPELLKAPVRDIAVAAGASKTAVAQLLRQLADDRILVKIRTAWAFADAERLMRRWLEGYASTLRPSLLIGRFQPSDRNIQDLEERVEAELTDLTWAWGGTAAANRIDGYYRGDETVLLVESPFDVTRRLRAPKKADGPLIVMKAPGPVALDGPEDHVVHPLLAYAEMLATDDPRALEAAERVRERFLEVPACSPLTDAQVAALRCLSEAWSEHELVLVGATALAFRFPSRETRDLDLAIQVAVETLPELVEQLEGWTVDSTLEHRVHGPEGVEIDLIPASRLLLEAGQVEWPRSGQVMNLLGIRLAFEHSTSVRMAPDLSIQVADPVALIVMKMVSYLDRPAERRKDLEDIAHVLEVYPDQADSLADARFSDAVLAFDRDPDDAGALLVGLEIKRIANAAELAAVRTFVRKAADEHDADQTLQQLLARAPRQDELPARVEALRLGLGE